MSMQWVRRARSALIAAAIVVGASAVPLAANAQFGNAMGYTPITPTKQGSSITLTGRNMTIRHGAQVQYSPAATQEMQDNYNLLLQAPTNGVSVYWFTRGAGGGRETLIFDGDPMRPDNKKFLEDRMMAAFQRGAQSGNEPEIVDEGLVRAVMAARANAMVFNAPSPPLAKMLIDLLNKRVTPVMQGRCTVGEGDLCTLSAVGGTMVGAGEAYYQGVRMPAAQALQRAGLTPITPFAADDNALTSSNAYATAMSAFMVHDGQRALEWADLTYAVDLNGMNSALGPLTYLVQTDRPFPWLNWNANRVKEMLRGSYLWQNDPGRIIQDPISMRASSIRSGSAWEAWAKLRDNTVIQLNSSDHNPAVRVMEPTASWDMATPEMMKYYVRPGKYASKGGFIIANANWDPYPMANHMEAFTVALGNLGIATMLRVERFGSEFFTGAGTRDILAKLPGGGGGGGGYSGHEVWQDFQGQLNIVPPEGYGGASGVEDLEAQTRIKGWRGMAAIDNMFRLLVNDLNNGVRWMEVRKAQDPNRQFGPASQAVYDAYRKVMPATGLPAGSRPARLVTMDFLKNTPGSAFYPTTGMPQ